MFFFDFALAHAFGLAPKVVDVTVLLVGDSKHANFA